MTFLTRLSTVVAAGVLAWSLALAPAAQAASASFTDPVGDQLTYRGKPSVAQKKHSDLTRVSIAHTSDGRVRLRFQVRDLNSGMTLPWFALHFSRGMISNPNQGNKFWVQWGSNLRCSAKPVRDNARNMVTVTFPRKCFPKRGSMTRMYAQAEWLNASKSRWVYDPTPTFVRTFVPNR